MIEVKMRFDGATLRDLEVDDRQDTGSHNGHLCRAQGRLDRGTILGEREGSQNEAIQAMTNDPSKRKEVAARVPGKSASSPVKQEQGKT